MKLTSTFLLLAVTFSAMAQNQITTPVGQPLVIGNQGVKLSNLNSSTPTQATNGKVLTVDANGLLFLAPDDSGTPSQWTSNAANIFFNTGNVGLGTNTPLQRLHVNGDINIPLANAIRINNIPFLRSPGTGNTIVGGNSGNSITTGGYNVLVGSEAGFGNSGALTGSGNAFIGYRAGYNSTSGSNNFYFGNQTGFSNTAGNYNVLIGSFAGQFSTASYMTAMGFEAGMYSNGPYNFYLGYQSGKGSAISPGNGQGNLFIGYRSGYVNTGAQNIFMGNSAGLNNTDGFNNIFLGSNSGLNNISGYNNVLIGFGSNLGGSNIRNSIALGPNSSVDINNAIILGATGAAQASVGIGNTAPTARLHVTAGGSIATGVRFQNLPTAAGTVYTVYVDANGNLMRSSTSNARETAENIGSWTLTMDEHLINNNTGSVLIGSGLTTIPNGYKLYVSEGILTERVKVAVKNTSEWRDNVFQENYKLKTVEEVEKFIKKNQHLPGVPTAKEMISTGNDLQKTDAILLEKIEEMMLYIIQLKNENIKLKSKINVIENQLKN